MLKVVARTGTSHIIPIYEQGWKPILPVFQTYFIYQESLMKKEVYKLHAQEEKYRLKQIAEKNRVKKLDKERWG